METPLDVLSRAASFVDVRDSVKTCSSSIGMKRTMAPANIPTSEEIPSKYYKYHHRRWREEDRSSETSSENKTDRKCMGTQTAVSSVHDREKDFYQPRDQELKTGQNSSRSLLDLDEGHRVHHYGGPRPGVCLSPHLPGSLTPDTPDNDSLPLNLSVSAQHSARSEDRNRDLDSRLNNTAVSDRGWHPMNGSSHNTSYHQHHTEHNSQGLCDSAIEEHFQRSLGKHYSSSTKPNKIVPTGVQPPKYNQQQPVNNNPQQPTYNQQQPMPSQPQQSRSQSQQSWSQSQQSQNQSHSGSSQETKLVIVTTPTSSAAGSVDDHFTKSLGDTWTRLKDEKETHQWTSVDDHFAKALGDQWLQIKRAQQNGDDPTHRSPNT